MAIRRRNTPPPFEVMSPRGTTPPGFLKPASREPMHEPVDADDRTPFWDSASTPLVVRVPRGYAVLVGAIVIGLIVLAYLVGDSRGYQRAVEEHTPNLPVQGQLDRPQVTAQDVAPLTAGGVGPGQQAPRQNPPTANRTTTSPPLVRQAGAPPAGQGRSTLASDPRKAGLNYFVLAHYPRAEADRLVQFLKTNGVEAGAFPRHNSSLFQVVALRGFTAGELSSDTRRQYEATLRRIGRAWKDGNRGGPDLSDMYPARFDG